MKQLLAAILVTYLLGLNACTTLDPNYEAPKVDVVGISKSETDSAALQFTIQLRIVNPNAQAIDLSGLYYELSLDGLEVVTGTANNIPTIEGYSEAVISVSSAASLINSLRLASRLMEKQNDSLDYELRAKLGTGSKWMPGATTITDSGTLSLSGR